MGSARTSFNFHELDPTPITGIVTMHQFFSGSPFYNFELTRILGTAASGGCDVADFLEVTGQIAKHDPESWYAAWFRVAARASQAARAARAQGHSTLAKAAYLRAANYYRAAPYMLSQGDRRILLCGEESAAHFEAATELMEGKVLRLTMRTADGVTFPGRLFLPPESASPARLQTGGGQKTPVLINCGGADSTMEELYFVFGVVGPELGYAVLNFDGPGQGLTLKRDGVPMRPDYEAVVSVVLDELFSLAKDRPDLDLDLERVCVAGISMGGYIALRTAAAESKSATRRGRVAACIAADPLYDMWDLAMTRLPGWYVSMWLSGWISDDFFDWSCNTHMKLDFPTRWEFKTTMHVMGQERPADVVREFKRYSLRGKLGGAGDDAQPILSRVTCPVLVTGASSSIYQRPDESTTKIMKELTSVPEENKEVWIPQSVGEGSLTGKVGAWNSLAAATFSFLDKQLGVQRPKPIS